MNYKITAKGKYPSGSKCSAIAELVNIKNVEEATDKAIRLFEATFGFKPLSVSATECKPKGRAKAESEAAK